MNDENNYSQLKTKIKEENPIEHIQLFKIVSNKKTLETHEIEFFIKRIQNTTHFDCSKEFSAAYWEEILEILFRKQDIRVWDNIDLASEAMIAINTVCKERIYLPENLHNIVEALQKDPLITLPQAIRLEYSQTQSKTYTIYLPNNQSIEANIDHLANKCRYFRVVQNFGDSKELDLSENEIPEVTDFFTLINQKKIKPETVDEKFIKCCDYFQADYLGLLAIESYLQQQTNWVNGDIQKVKDVAGGLFTIGAIKKWIYRKREFIRHKQEEQSDIPV